MALRVRGWFEIVDTEGRVSDWIDKLKQQRDAANKDRDKKRDWQLRSDKLVSQKGPALWKSVIARIKSDSEQLAKTFPEDEAMHVSFTEQDKGLGFVIEKTGLPYVRMHARWIEGINGVGIDLEEQRTMNDPKQSRQLEIVFSLGAEDAVRMSFETRSHALPETLAEQLLKKLLDIA